MHKSIPYETLASGKLEIKSPFYASDSNSFTQTAQIAGGKIGIFSAKCLTTGKKYAIIYEQFRFNLAAMSGAISYFIRSIGYAD